MKRWLSIAYVSTLLGVLAISGCTLTGYLRADVTLVGWEQRQYSSGAYSKYVRITYEVLNIGEGTIGTCEVWFEVECADGSVYTENGHTFGIEPGQRQSDSTLIAVSGKQAVRVSMSDYELTLL